MKVIDTRGLRAIVAQAHLTGKDGVTFGLPDVVAIADELELARSATKEAGDLLAEIRPVLEHLADPQLLELERKRIRVDVLATILPRIAALIDPDPEHPIDVGQAPTPSPLDELVIHRGQLPPPDRIQ